MTADETVPDIVLGDADGNGKVELQDAHIVLKSALKILILPEERRQSADVNKNGSIDLEDANIVLKMALRII